MLHTLIYTIKELFRGSIYLGICMEPKYDLSSEEVKELLDYIDSL